MKLYRSVSRFALLPSLNLSLCTTWMISLALVACGGGGGSGSGSGSGGGGVVVPEAMVLSPISDVAVVEGSNGQFTLLEFQVLLDKPVQRGVVLTYSTSTTAKQGIDSTGSAKGGSACGTGVDFIDVANARVTLSAGAVTGKLTVLVCADAVFEPNETLKITWSSDSGGSGAAIGTIINDDAGGLNGSGAPTVMGAKTAFGRDGTNPVNGGVPLGFSLATAAPTCTVDQVTGLTWQGASGPASVNYAGLSSLVNTANNTGSGLCGKTDWRVPTVNELLSLIDFRRTVAPFNALQDSAMSGNYWSNEVVTTATTDAWTVSVGDRGAVSYLNKGDSANVRLVSGGAYSALGKFSNATACNDSTRYKNLLDETIEDSKTGLMWKQCTEGASGAQCNIPEPLIFNSDVSVLARVAQVNASQSVLGLGYNDWRIPTVKELASLVDRCTGGGSTHAIDSTIFPGNRSASYVSATYDAMNTQQFWYVDFSDGSVAVAPLTNKYLRLVRAGQ